ncbi:MAG: hypothetical protein ACYTFW_24795 [Planctomycetota bacterium]|jgi:hypothetical protein
MSKAETAEMISFAVLVFIVAAVILALEALFGSVTWLASVLLPGVTGTLAIIAVTAILLVIVVIIFTVLKVRKWF